MRSGHQNEALRMTLSRSTSFCALVSVALLYLTGCGSNSAATQYSSTPALQHSSSTVLPGENGDVQKLADLWLKRSKETAHADFPVGAGDILEISVPAIEELRTRTVRISGDGTIALPFVGKLKAAGLTEEELQQELIERLKQYMYEPRVIVFVKEYRSRQVAVLGAGGKTRILRVAKRAEKLV